MTATPVSGDWTERACAELAQEAEDPPYKSVRETQKRVAYATDQIPSLEKDVEQAQAVEATSSTAGVEALPSATRRTFVP